MLKYASFTSQLTAFAAGRLLPTFREVCTVKADLSGLLRNIEPTHVMVPDFLSPQLLPVLRTIWEVKFEVEIFFGQTTLCAGVIWQEDVRCSCLSYRLSSLTLLLSCRLAIRAKLEK